jgi:glycosyltransferase involved in cell wall biosynthesis
MKIVIFSMGPVFPDCVHGGSQRMLREIAKYLGSAGHSVRIYCTQRPDNSEVFVLSPGVTVFPTLRFKCRYPEPYYTAPYNLSAVICNLLEAAENADVFYVHDGELAYSFVYDDLPTVISFRDLVYPDTLACGLSFRGDTLIVASDFMKRCAIDLLGRFRLGIEERVKMIPNGVDLLHFKPLTRASPVSVPDDAMVILCPHRPDKRKGFSLALRLVQKLKASSLTAARRPLLLIPKWIDSAINGDDTHEYQSLYDTLLDEAHELGISEHVIIHDWMRDDQIPGYYSRASLVLCIGTFIEAFGNVPLESAACGVPSIVSTVGANSGKLPEPLCYEVPPNDLDAVFDAASRGLTTPFPVEAAREFLGKRYSMKKMVEDYSAQITGQRQLPPLQIRRLDPFAGGVDFRQPAWCRILPDGIYNDYAYEALNEPDLLRLYHSGILPAEVRRLESSGFSTPFLRDLVTRGFLTYS